MSAYENGPGAGAESQYDDTDHGTRSLSPCATATAPSCTLALPCDPRRCASETILTPTGAAPAAHRPRRSIPANARTSDQARAAVARRWSATARRNEAFRILRALELTAADRAELLALACGRGAR